MKKERVRIFDTTLRDGEQSPGCSMNLEEKLRLARKLEGLGVDILEAGFPIASDGDFSAAKAVVIECRDATVAALSRNARDYFMQGEDAVLYALRGRIYSFADTCPLLLMHN